MPSYQAPPMPAMAEPMPETGPKEVACYYLEVYDDGTFKVVQEAEEAEAAPGAMMAEAASEPSEDAGGQSFDNLDDALNAMREMAGGGAGDAQAGFDSVGASEPNGPFQAGRV